MSAPDLTSAGVVLGRRELLAHEFPFRLAKRALPMLQAMAPRLAVGMLTEADFDRALIVLAMAVQPADPDAQVAAMQDWPITPDEVATALDTIVGLNRWRVEKPGPNVDGATGGTGTGTPSTPT